MSREQVVNEIHRYAPKHFARRKYVMFGIADTLQADLIEMQPFAAENRGHRYILIVIDVFSKVVFAEALKDKTGLEVTQAMERIIKKFYQHNPQHQIKNLHSDEGKEFCNGTMARMLQKYKINHYSTFSSLKASIVERLIRTTKHKLYKLFTLHGNHKWLQTLPEVIDRYNNTW